MPIFGTAVAKLTHRKRLLSAIRALWIQEAAASQVSHSHQRKLVLMLSDVIDSAALGNPGRPTRRTGQLFNGENSFTGG